MFTLAKYTKEFRYNLALAYPVILGMLGHTLVGLVDNIMVGRLGTAPLAAVSLGNSFIFIALSLGIGFSTAITAMVAESHALGTVSKTAAILKHSFLLCLSLGIFLFVGVLAAKPLLFVMRQSTEVVSLTLPYLNIVAVSLVPLLVFQAFKQFLDGLSETKYPMYATLVGNLINIACNYVLIFGHFGFPKLGIVGAAIGTLISRIFMVLFIWLLLQYKHKFKVYLKEFHFKNIQKKVFEKIISLGFPSALQMLFEVAIFTAAIWLSGVLGKNPQAANQIALNLSSMTFMVAMGISVAAMIRVGNQKGLQDFIALRRIAISLFLLAFLFSVIFAVFFFMLNSFLPTFYLDVDAVLHYKDNQEVISIAAKLLIIAAFFQISDAFQVVVLGALRGLQDVKIPTLITFIAYWMVGFPISYYLGLYTDYKSQGIWIGLLAGLTTSAILLYIRFHFLTRKNIV